METPQTLGTQEVDQVMSRRCAPSGSGSAAPRGLCGLQEPSPRSEVQLAQQWRHIDDRDEQGHVPCPTGPRHVLALKNLKRL